MRLRSLAQFFVLFCGGSPLWAHPHVWVEVKAEVAVEAGYVEGVWTEWTFDDAFSQLILMDNDTDANGKLSAPESAAVKKGYFDNLKSFQYFSHFDLGARTLETPVPTKFTASTTAEGRVVYRFFLPLAVRLDPKNALAVSFYDDSFFTDMVFEKKNPVTLTATGGKASLAFRKDPKKTFYGGQITPTFAYVTWGPS
jgi:ABC-type uncharacterized transport system substrate-binding protein